MSYTFIPNKQQQDALEDMLRWWKKDDLSQVYELSGRPGTGKTTLVKYFIEKAGIKDNEFALCAFTGKATLQLIRKGNYAKTIHSTFYTLVDELEYDEEGKLKKLYGKLRKKKAFKIKPSKEILAGGLKLIIIDEGRMVGKKIAEDLLGLGIKVLVMGDIDQLPPVLDAAYFLINPNRHLTEIMRQAEGDPIVTVSHKLINGERLEFGKYGDNVLVIPYENINEQLLTSADVLLASRNRTRDNINNTIRYEINKRENADPTVGDKVICRQNDWGLSLYEDGTEISLVNGMSGSITNVYKETYLKNTIEIDFQPDFTKGYFEHLEINHGYYTGNFEQRATIKSSFKPAGHLVEQGDCITVHLSQGSEYPFVCYFLENYGWNRRFMNQLHYTAATRAQNKLVIVQ